MAFLNLSSIASVVLAPAISHVSPYTFVNRRPTNYAVPSIIFSSLLSFYLLSTVIGYLTSSKTAKPYLLPLRYERNLV
jgi:hypothetical protein